MNGSEDKTAGYDSNSSTLAWAKKLQAIAQTGLTYAQDQYDIERYQSVRQIAAEMLAANSTGLSSTQLIDLFTSEIGYATPKSMSAPPYFQTKVYCWCGNAATVAGLSLEVGRMSATALAWLRSAKSKKSLVTMS